MFQVVGYMQRVEGARKFSLRKQSTFGDTTTGFPAKWCLRNERRDSLLMMHYYPYLGRASDWLKFSLRHNQSEALMRSE